MPNIHDNIMLSDTIYSNIVRARAALFSTLSLLTMTVVGSEPPEPSPEKSVQVMNLEIGIEYATLAIMKLDLNEEEKIQEGREVKFLKHAGLLRDGRFENA